MRTAIPPALRQDPEVLASEKVLRTCVHCGFCNATCPTYLLSGNELEGPRGRIYLIKNLLEGETVPSPQTLDHLDHCLGCLACETTCPSGVVYSRLLEAARPRLEARVERPLVQRLLRGLLLRLLPHPGRFRLSLRLAGLGRLARPLLPATWRHLLEMAPGHLPAPSRLATPGVHPAQGERRARVLLLIGCAQQVLGPQINDAALRLLTRLGVEVVIPGGSGCCGALTFHMGERKQSLGMMRRTVEDWHRELERDPLDAIALSTSGCATAVKEYGHLFRHDPALGPKAAAVVPLVKDISEVVLQLGLGKVLAMPRLKVAYHDACSLQHGQRIKDPPRRLLREAGFEVVEVPEAHLCCGSAGTYNLLEPEFARPLLERKAGHIAQVRPQVVAAGNIGCIEQLARGVEVPVLHTVELLDWATGGPKPAALEKLPPPAPP
ncbi:MAG: glycolate oxidase subunit GlcF [Candidatus Handelsmanbacteria bacterium]|nr:glycolate oxidase subunit GlcF [Candidatus Handelsmanbacteria bacterium]